MVPTSLAPTDLVFCSTPVANTPLLDRLEPVAAAGFRGIAVQPGDIWQLEEQGMPAAEIAARITDAGLVVTEIDCAACWFDRQMRVEQIGGMTAFLRQLRTERVVETAARIGAQSVTAIDLSESEAPVTEAAEGFAALCDLAARHGLKAQIEWLPVGGIRSLRHAWDIVRGAGRANGGLTVDAWHFFRSGSRLDELAEIPGDRIHSVQLCDAPAAAQVDLWAELMSARLLPGEGDLDLTGLIRTLDRIGATAPMAIEVFHPRQETQTLDAIARDWAGSAHNVMAKARDTA
ncbi:MAG: sugar phosphate isomerase/epimerase [Sphingomonadales bacterium]|nr:sugar phosphate isomerase/epimerase [Sphingomonadales bacterium]